jgi:hypothetical protein
MKEEFELCVNLLFWQWCQINDKYQGDFEPTVLNKNFPNLSFTWIPCETSVMGGAYIVTGGL